MRTTPADPVEFTELPIGRLGHPTLQRVLAAVEIHHRAGPWAPCPEDFSRVLRVLHDRPRPTVAPATRPSAAPATRPSAAIEVALYA